MRVCCRKARIELQGAREFGDGPLVVARLRQLLAAHAFVQVTGPVRGPLVAIATGAVFPLVILPEQLGYTSRRLLRRSISSDMAGNSLLGRSEISETQWASAVLMASTSRSLPT